MGITLIPIEEDEGNVDRYFLSKRLAIERRTGGGFIKGIMEKTLFTSAIYLREHFRLAVLIVEGQVNFEHAGFSPEAIRGALSSMVLLYGINVVATPNMVMARDLLHHFGSVRRIVNATEDEFRSMRGIGAKKARGIVKVLNAEYEAVDTERNLEDAIEAEPSLLFRQPVVQVARQLYIFSDEGRRHFVDMVYLDPAADVVYFIELKRGRIAREHVAQLRRYLDHASHAAAIAAFLRKGTTLRGLLATVEPGGHEPEDDDITVRIVGRKRAIAVLKRLRAQRLAAVSG